MVIARKNLGAHHGMPSLNQLRLQSNFQFQKKIGNLQKLSKLAMLRGGNENNRKKS